MAMENIKEKNAIVNKWLGDHRFYNIQNSSDSYFIKADGNSTRMVIAIRGEKEINSQEIIEFAARNHRQAWVADIKEDNNIEWEVL